MNNFLNNIEHKIILCRMLKIVYAENSEQFFMRKQWTILINAKKRFYEYNKQIWIYSKYDVQRENFINVETDFINAEKYIRLLWNSNMKKHSDLAFKFRKHDFTWCFMRKQWTIF